MTHGFEDVKKILVIKLRHIGDVLLTVPVFRALRENFPHAHIAALVNSGTEEVLTGNPLIDDVIVFDRGIKKMNPLKKYLRELSFLGMVQAKGFDMTADLTSGDRAAIISFVSGARYRLAYDPGNDGFIGKRYLYTHLAKKDGRKHMVLQNLDIVSQFGINTDNLTVDIFIPEVARIFVKKVFEENNINKTFMLQRDLKDNEDVIAMDGIPKQSQDGIPRGVYPERGDEILRYAQNDRRRDRNDKLEALPCKKDKIVHVHPTSRWLFKCWKDEYMAEVISWLLAQGIKIIVTSSPDNREMKKAKRILSLVQSRITHHALRIIDLCGKTTIKQLAAISAASDLFLGVDSAPMHIAAAVGTPVVALFGPTAVNVWGPWDSSQQSTVSSQSLTGKRMSGIQTFGLHTVIQRDWDCVPCGQDGCNRSKKSKCLYDITSFELYDLIEKYLNLRVKQHVVNKNYM